MDTRAPLKEKEQITLYAFSVNPKHFGYIPQTFTIHSLLGKGGSAIVYEASSIGSNNGVLTGVLKEFYPRGFSCLERDENHALQPVKSAEYGEF